MTKINSDVRYIAKAKESKMTNEQYEVIQGEYKGKVTIAKKPEGITKDITIKEYEKLKKEGLIK